MCGAGVTSVTLNYNKYQLMGLKWTKSVQALPGGDTNYPNNPLHLSSSTDYSKRTASCLFEDVYFIQIKCRDQKSLAISKTIRVLLMSQPLQTAVHHIQGCIQLFQRLPGTVPQCSRQIHAQLHSGSSQVFLCHFPGRSHSSVSSLHPR